MEDPTHLVTAHPSMTGPYRHHKYDPSHKNINMKTNIIQIPIKHDPYTNVNSKHDTTQKLT